MLCDHHRAYMSEDIQDWFLDKGIQFMIFPKGRRKFLNPYDNSFNANFKTKYYQLLVDVMEAGKVDNTMKLRTIMKAYDMVKEQSILRCFKHCGITGGKLY